MVTIDESTSAAPGQGLAQGQGLTPGPGLGQAVDKDKGSDKDKSSDKDKGSEKARGQGLGPDPCFFPQQSIAMSVYGLQGAYAYKPHLLTYPF